MKILGIGGFERGSGKTTLVARILEVLPGWGALKSSPGPHRHGLQGSWDLTAQPTRITWPEPAAWLRSEGWPPPEAIVAVRERFSGCPGLVVEGITASLALEASRLYLVVRAGARELKPGAAAVIGGAAAIVLNRAPGDDPREVERARGLATAAAPGARIIVVDAGEVTDAGTRALVEEIRLWAEC